MKHDLKCWPKPFYRIFTGQKTAEFRKNDRDFQIGDFLNLKEWCPDKQGYTGRSTQRVISHIQEGFNIPEGYVVMSLSSADFSR